MPAEQLLADSARRRYAVRPPRRVASSSRISFGSASCWSRAAVVIGSPGQSHGPRSRHLPESGHDLAGGDADPQLQRPCRPLTLPGQGGLHLEGAQAGPQGIVVVSNRSAEDRQHGVADELLERTAEVDDGLAQEPQRAVDARPDLLRVELVDEAGVADQIGEERASRRAGRRALSPSASVPRLPAALVAEAGAWGGRRTTIGTGHRDLPGTPECYAGPVLRTAAVAPY